MHARQNLRQIAIALIGDDDRRAGFRHQKIGAGHADVGGQKFCAQFRARLSQKAFRLAQIAVLRQPCMHAAELGLHVLLVQMHGGRDDMRGRLAAKLNDVFAKVSLNRFDPGPLQRSVKSDLFGHHRFALGDTAGAARFGQINDDAARLLRCARPMHMAAGLDDFALVGFEINVKVSEHMIAQIARLIAQRFKLGQAISDGGALGDEICAHVAERFLQLPISQSGAGVFPELWRCRISCHVEKAFMADCPN